MSDALAFGTTLACLVTGLTLAVRVVTRRYRFRGFAPAFLTIELALLAQAVLDVVALLDGHRPAEPVTHLAYLLTSLGVLPVALALTGRDEDRWTAGVLAVTLFALAVIVVRLTTTGRGAV
ncbi:hypothetical protein [Amycolatopsis sp. H20-H5]|uniref:hypothetical protein n=1 Tax=Amycolatopsis sp. H20-H5 TaxID=3046309 RepID=UPI002DBD4BB0|nr:hypothetical protein [Amycolatopsis sp. H20-H5]MEC3973829.1 hypothetical protein [Amycolatopsis sp. H20-H5]